MRDLLHAESHFWTLTRLLVVVSAMTGLLYAQATDFDWTEVYSVIELGVVLIAFEAGVLLGVDRRTEVTNWVRLFVVLSGMAILLFMNATQFDSTEAWVLVGVPAVTAVFEGVRTWTLATVPLPTNGRSKARSSRRAVRRSKRIQSTVENLVKAAKSACAVYEELPRSAKGLVITVATVCVCGFSFRTFGQRSVAEDTPE